MPRPRPAARPAQAVAVALVLALALAGCGSRVDPGTVAVASGRALGVADEQGVVTDGPAAGPGAGGSTGTGGGAAGPGATAGTGGGGTAGSSGGGGTSGGAPPGADSSNDADGGVRAGPCDGFRNGTGISDDAITLANIADVSGPVPGLFQAAQDATTAFVTYYNRSNPEGICGRSLALSALDTRSDSGGDQQAYTRACDEAFAAVGSVSSQDQGGAATAEGCGLPDLRAFTVTPQRAACSTCFAAYAIAPNLQARALSDYLRKAEPRASQRIAVYYVDVPAAQVNAESFAAGFERQGLGVVRVQGIDTAEFNYSPYAQQMKSDGAELVMYFGPYQFTIRLQEAMRQQGVEAAFLTDPTVYDVGYVEQGGETVEGTLVYSVVQRFDDTRIPEMVLYRQWLERVAPGAVPNYYGLFAWSAARLFVQEATRLGGRLDRASLVQAVRGVRGWSANGIHAPMAVGAKTTPGCLKVLQLTGGSWRQVSPGDFLCGPVFDSGVGG